MIRLAEQRDMAGCAAVVNRWIDATDWFERVVSVEDIDAALGKALTVRRIWVVGDPVTGYLTLNPDDGHIGALYCDHTGQGHGKALLDAAKDGRDFLSLNTHVVNTRAQAFYRREGFAAISEHDPEPPETQRELRMEWRA